MPRPPASSSRGRSPIRRRKCISRRGALNVTTLTTRSSRTPTATSGSISSTRCARAGRPAAWILTSYWSDQKYGDGLVGLAARRRARCGPRACPARRRSSSARRGSARRRPAGAATTAMSPAAKTCGAACERRVAHDAAVERQARALEPLGVRDARRARRRSRRRRVRRVGGRARGGASTPCSRCRSAQRAPSSGPSASIGCGAMSMSVTSRPSLRAVDATSQPMKPAPTIATRARVAQRGLERERVVEVAQRVDVRAGLARPRAGAGAGGDDQRSYATARRRS